MSAPIPPCYCCEDRIPACHDACERYKAWKIDHENLKEREREIKSRDKITTDYTVKSYERMLKKSRKKGRGPHG